MDTDHPNSNTLTLPFPNTLKIRAMKSVHTKTGPTGSHIPGPALMPCGFPPSYSQETFQTMFKIVETLAMARAAFEKYLRHGGRALVVDRLFLAKKRSVHGMRNKTPVAMYIPAGC
jgi:hypothetical protein